MKNSIFLQKNYSAMFILCLFGTVSMSSSMYSQAGKIGINTVNPKATLDINAKTDGSSQAEGLLIPRLTGDQIQTMTSNIQPVTESLMIYATAAPASPTSKVSKITQPGYYFWNGNNWESVGINSNIYTADGSITTPLAARNVDLNGKNLVFSGNGSVGIGTAPSASAKLDVAGTIKASAIDYNSDERLKQNITDIESSEGSLLKLRPVTYFWNEAGKKKGGNAQLQYGLIAQEVEKFLPNIVSTDHEGYKSVNYNELIPLLLKTVQEQDKKIGELQREMQLMKKSK
ncbi:tail fiber domain-containing protein [Chryseobacterium indologenes]|uniref:tail fiber domain-containing protein n=1 Tax=Chryseobacterium indologenes TaxID=253 RepID=UPI000F5094D7|nr:tail fiber domain-containing protein [Chryseobacterium indologenes]AYZ36280.1 tail fiber domain-containing protein [Chryseobacterium indologenes]MBF6644928.1 tail fiber domain-containing protein [Chryseobacterium indologenes]MBU3047500.1 tail fiber domain-containing protein [Chryseobacterium indologenes]MEB4759203.1 tail fiber domain-containing protein [Chryseobacterium indologenes]QQQ71388.1 tail fiber domain-containing protein [Chryseobacterium indologenes]